MARYVQIVGNKAGGYCRLYTEHNSNDEINSCSPKGFDSKKLASIYARGRRWIPWEFIHDDDGGWVVGRVRYL